MCVALRSTTAAAILEQFFDDPESIKEEDIHGSYLAQAQAIFPDTVSVDDGDIFDVPLREV